METAQGTVKLSEILASLNENIAKTIYEKIESSDSFEREDWNDIRSALQKEGENPGDLQKIWWLFPLYRNDPEELQERLKAVIEKSFDSTNERRGTDSVSDETEYTDSDPYDDGQGRLNKPNGNDKDESPLDNPWRDE